MKLPLAYYGNPILRKKGALVETIDEEIKQLVENMVETMHVENGMGLAAPQIHRSLALFIVCVPVEGPEEDTWIPGELQVFINPKIISHTQQFWDMSEGCLSIPKLRASIPRPVGIVIEYTTLAGERITKEFSGLEARVIMHENDHINGVLFIDRIKGKARQDIEPALKEIKKKYHPN
jgi:peptide deformylase